MSKHGHVIPNPDGTKARCGGPALCAQCKQELLDEMKRVLSAMVYNYDKHGFVDESWWDAARELTQQSP